MSGKPVKFEYMVTRVEAHKLEAYLNDRQPVWEVFSIHNAITRPEDFQYVIVFRRLIDNF